MNHYYHHAGYCDGSYDPHGTFIQDKTGQVHRVTQNGGNLKTLCKRLSWDGLGPMKSVLSKIHITCPDCRDLKNVHGLIQEMPITTRTTRTANPPIPGVILRDGDWYITTWTVTDQPDNNLDIFTNNSYKQASPEDSNIKYWREQADHWKAKYYEESGGSHINKTKIDELKAYIRSHGLLVPGEPVEVTEEQYPLNIEVKPK